MATFPNNKTEKGDLEVKFRCKDSLWKLGKNVVVLYGCVSSLYVCASEGHVGGNGGDVVVCHKGSGNPHSLELLDFYEARTLRDIFHDLNSTTGSYKDKLKTVLSDLGRVSPKRAELYSKQVEDFEQNARFMNGAVLTDIPDSQHIALPIGCHIEQAITQIDPKYPEDKRYIVNNDIWKILNENDRAGLVLHEIIYREALRWKHLDSRATRYLNSILTSARREDLTFESFMTILAQTDFMHTDYHDLELKVFNYYYPFPRCFDEVFGRDDFRMGPPATKFHNGVLVQAYLSDCQPQIYSNLKLPLRISSEVRFYETGILSFTYIPESRNITEDRAIWVQNKPVNFTAYVRFYASGEISSGMLFEKTSLTKADGTEEIFAEKTCLIFDEVGNVTSIDKFGKLCSRETDN